MNGKEFSVNTGTQKLRNPYVLDGIEYKTEEEYLLAKLLTQQGVEFYYERIQLPGWIPDIIFRYPHRLTGAHYPGSWIWGIETKGPSPLRFKWTNRSVQLWKKHRIPILVLSRSDLEQYIGRGNFPMKPFRRAA